MDFGLGHMPDCQLARASELQSGRAAEGGAEARENQAALMDNLKSLSRYGSLVMQLEGPGLPPTHTNINEAGLAAGVVAAAAMGNPVITSYSIHYTKLYEDALQYHSPGEPATTLPGRSGRFASHAGVLPCSGGDRWSGELCRRQGA